MTVGLPAGTVGSANARPRPLKRVRNRYWAAQFRLFLRALAKGKISVRKLLNVLSCHVAYVLKWEIGPRVPYILSMELWNECNAGCLFCRDKRGKIHDINRHGTGFISKGKMPAEMAVDIIQQLKDDILIAVLYTNGEPLLYRDLSRVVRFASDRRVATMIATNGLLFTEENARAILEAGIDFIKIQLSGFTQDIYGIQIRYGDVEHLKENIRMLARMNREGGYGAVIMIDYILYNYNGHQLPLIRKFCRELGLMMNVRPGNPLGGLEDREPPLIDRSLLPLKISCEYLWKVLQVNFNGDILPCCEAVVWSNSRPYETYEIGETNIRNVWQGAAAQSFRRRMKTEGRAGTAMCSQCTRVGVRFKW